MAPDTTPPDIHDSTREQRERYVREKWRCLANCEICGKCSILHGRDAEEVYRDYIDGIRTYMEVSLTMRQNNM